MQLRDGRLLFSHAPATPAARALLQGLRRRGYEPQLTQALAAIFAVEPVFAAKFVRLVLQTLDNAALADAVPSQLACETEEVIPEGRLDLRFRGDGWDLILELKIHAGFGAGWFERYVDALSDQEHAYVAAITRDIPTYGEPDPGTHPRWLGSTRWRSLLTGLRELRPDDAHLRSQWLLFLDVLEMEGSMGFTRADPDLFAALRARAAGDHPHRGFAACRSGAAAAGLT